MNFYAQGFQEAASTFLKNADYADTAAQLWGKVSPAKAPDILQAVGGLAGGLPGGFIGASVGSAGGGHLGHELGDLLGKGHVGRVVGGLVGQGVGMHQGMGLGFDAGAAVTNKAYGALVGNRRAAAIRKYAPKVGLGLGATALAAGLANHFLSRKSDQ